MEREVVQLGGCLLHAKLNFPSKRVYVCGLCSNRTDMVGNLADNCKATQTSTPK